jgi:hypothetical protein
MKKKKVTEKNKTKQNKTNKISQQGELKQRNQNLKQDEFGSATKFMWPRGSG